MTDKIREGFASVLRRGDNLPTEIVVEMLCGVLRDQEPVAWAHPSGGVLQHRRTGLEQSTYTIPLYAAPITAAAPKPDTPLVNPASLLPAERECCGTFPRSPHRSTCRHYRGKHNHQGAQS